MRPPASTSTKSDDLGDKPYVVDVRESELHVYFKIFCLSNPFFEETYLRKCSRTTLGGAQQHDDDDDTMDTLHNRLSMSDFPIMVSHCSFFWKGFWRGERVSETWPG